MPIHCSIATVRITQDEFKLLASEVMHHVFAIHNEFGRLFDVDVLINASGLFEFKASDAIHPRHRGQTLNYLLLLDLGHGKVINVRPVMVGHEFVNCPKRLVELRNPVIYDQRWEAHVAGAEAFRERLMPLIADWGAGLEVSLYEEAVTHFLGGEARVLLPVPVIGNKGRLADQRMKLAAPDVAFKITALQARLDEFETQARKLIQHTALKAVHWANITQETITFTTLT